MPAGLLDYATYFDRHYLIRGLALYRSLLRHSPPFRLWILCLDEETFTILSKLQFEHVELIRLSELERADPALLAVKPTRRGVEYYWTCTAAFLGHLFEHARLAHAGVAAHQHEVAVARAGALPRVEQEGQLALAPDHRRARR